MFGPWIHIWLWAKETFALRARVHKPHFNFILLHYIFIVTLTLITSLIMYGARNMSYIDALLFGAGAATQSGLNPVDINTLKLYQQICIIIVASIANPIVINSVVVFIRLYWFEKRFQKVVKDARALRRTRTRSRTNSEARVDMSVDGEERGVGNRQIKVLHAGSATMKEKSEEVNREKGDAIGVPTDKAISEHDTEHKRSKAATSEEDAKHDTGEEIVKPHRGITFSDEVNPPILERVPSPELVRIPEQRTTEQHIAFVQSQRNLKDKSTLRIPGPRDYDKGSVPQQVTDEDDVVEHENDGTGLQRKNFRSAFGSHGNGSAKRDFNTGEAEEARANKKVTWSEFRHGSKSLLRDAFRPSLRARTKSIASLINARTENVDPTPYLSWHPTVGRNSAFIDLTEDQREELGGIEYRALKTLAIVLICYYFGFHIFGLLFFLPFIKGHSNLNGYVEDVGVSSTWWGIYTPAAHFTDLGYTLTPDSMVSFQRAVLPLVVGCFLIIIGNTGFPCMLRFSIWLCQIVVPRTSPLWEELRFLLAHPRRCFTLLFPSEATWWLFWVLLILTGLDVLLYVVLDLDYHAVKGIPPGLQFLDGLYQASSTRTAGFSVVSLADLHPAIQVSFMVMMYISIFPIAISIRASNVYEEKSLGLYSSVNEEQTAANQSYVGAHLRRQLSFDLWYVFLGLFVIAIVEGDRLQDRSDISFSLFAVLFEVVSAYGTVGLSLGYPTVNTSFCSQFSTISKLVIVAMEVRGRHRGLPYALDRAILLPSERLHRVETEDLIRRVQTEPAPFQQSEGSADGLPNMNTSFRRRRRRSSVAGAGVAPSAGATAVEPKGKGLGGFLQGALSAGPVRASTWKGV